MKVASCAAGTWSATTGCSGHGDTRTISITNPLGNLGITEVDLNIPLAAAFAISTADAGQTAFGLGFVNEGTVSVAGTGPWTAVYPGSSSGAVILPAGAAGSIIFAIDPEASESTSGVADAYHLTLTIHYTDGSAQTGILTLYEGSLATTSVSAAITTTTAGTSWTYTVTLGPSDSGVPLTWFSSPSVSSVATASVSASFGTPTFTTSAALTSTSAFVTQLGSAQGVTDGVCTSPCYYSATVDAGTPSTHDTGGLLGASFPGTMINVTPNVPTKVDVGLAAYDATGYSIDYVNSITPAPVAITLADSYGNAITSSSASGAVTFTVLQGYLSHLTSTLTCGGSSCILSPIPDYQPLTSSSTPLNYGTFDLISASLVVPSTSSLAGTYAGSSHELSIGNVYAASPTPTITRYVPSVGATASATGAGNAVAGSKVNLAATVTGAYGGQDGVPINFSLTSAVSGVAYTGTFSNGLSWIVAHTATVSGVVGVASVNFTADTTATDAATAQAVFNDPQTSNPANTLTSGTTGVVTSIPAAPTNLKILTFSDTAITNPSSYAKEGGYLYLNILLEDEYGNSVTWNSAFALQINLATSAGGLSATTIYITSSQKDTYHSGYQVQFTAPKVLGTVTLSATTTQPSISAGTATVHVVGLAPLVSLTPPAVTKVSKATIDVNITAIPSPAEPVGTVVVSFMYSLSGAANVTAPVTSTNSSGASFTSFSVTLSSGANTLKVYATDSNGYVGVSTFIFTYSLIVSATTFTSTGAAQATSAGFTGDKVTFTNTGGANTVNVYFVWYNSADQIVSIGAQLNVSFTAGGSQTFFNAYSAPGTYTVQTFVRDTSNNALSASYPATVTIP
jgi:hypothetical protein